jgi:hypothetical protein
LAESLVELAETRSVARALRFAGFGLEFTSAEEVSHVAAAEPDVEQNKSKAPQSVFPEGNGESKTGTKASSVAIENPTRGNGATPQHCGNGRATQAQVRALYSLSKRAQYTDQHVTNMLAPFEVSRFEDLSREAASKLISALQTEATA